MALTVLCTGMLMIVLDATVVNVALPSTQSDLGFTASSLAWVVNAYLISFGGLLLLAGRLGDLPGRRNVFLAGLGVFTGASLLCGLAQNQSLLVGARFVQGVGGALTSAVILGMIVTMFPEPHEQAKAIGIYAFVASAGGALGLAVLATVSAQQGSALTTAGQSNPASLTGGYHLAFRVLDRRGTRSGSHLCRHLFPFAAVSRRARHRHGIVT